MGRWRNAILDTKWKRESTRAQSSLHQVINQRQIETNNTRLPLTIDQLLLFWYVEDDVNVATTKRNQLQIVSTPTYIYERRMVMCKWINGSWHFFTLERKSGHRQSYPIKMTFNGKEIFNSLIWYYNHLYIYMEWIKIKC